MSDCIEYENHPEDDGELYSLVLLLVDFVYYESSDFDPGDQPAPALEIASSYDKDSQNLVVSNSNHVLTFLLSASRGSSPYLYHGTVDFLEFVLSIAYLL